MTPLFLLGNKIILHFSHCGGDPRMYIQLPPPNRLPDPVGCIQSQQAPVAARHQREEPALKALMAEDEVCGFLDRPLMIQALSTFNLLVHMC